MGGDGQMTTVRDLFEQMPQSFHPPSAAGVDAVIQFAIDGEGGGNWLAVIRDGTLTVSEGVSESPSLTISASAEDYLAIGTGQLNEQLAFMTGRIRARGNTRLAMKLPKIFRR
jgi:putative sterol carrier protein